MWPTLDLSPPEGFCFYALHPLDYVELANRVGLPARPVGVIGIRTIGATLSAVVAADLRRSGDQSRSVERITVRPTGHPYDRKTLLDGEALDFVQTNQRLGSTFLIVDEGPGLSGSSFLSVAEALSPRGVADDRILFLCSRAVDSESLIDPDAVVRWKKFQVHSVAPTTQLPSADLLPVGDWRPRLFSENAYRNSTYRDSDSWPSMWTTMTSRKFFSADLKTIFKCEGLGRFGAVVRDRASAVANAGFGPAPGSAIHGFSAYPMLGGKLLSASDLTEAVLMRIAEYVGFRASEFPLDLSDQSSLEQMTMFNFQQITGSELAEAFALELRYPVIADARMMPHEWIQLHDGRLLKLDSAAHGDNHFYPGPTDVAWDLAAVLVEWQLSNAAADYFLSCYENISGDKPRPRL